MDHAHSSYSTATTVTVVTETCRLLVSHRSLECVFTLCRFAAMLRASQSLKHIVLMPCGNYCHPHLLTTLSHLLEGWPLCQLAHWTVRPSTQLTQQSSKFKQWTKNSHRMWWSIFCTTTIISGYNFVLHTQYLHNCRKDEACLHKLLVYTWLLTDGSHVCSCHTMLGDTEHNLNFAWSIGLTLLYLYSVWKLW